MEIKLEVAQISALGLKPGDTLMVKLVGDYMETDDIHSLHNKLKEVFPNNQIFVFGMPTGSDIVFEKVELQAVLNCSEAPKGYCDSCNCGKKEASLQST